ncbi:DMT family transporter [Polaromonas hydrogenivorans]|uniref:DMT family transporter n=1 Tax=Polaromonas hydrogenivorans TaxID=335476 RepID=A0AAU7LZY6_9BURK
MISKGELDVKVIYGALIATMAIWGLNIVVIKIAITWFEPAAFAALRMIIASIVLTIIFLAKGVHFPALTWRQLVAAVLCAFLMVYVNQILFNEGLRRSTATNGSLINALSPLASALLAAFVFRERLTLKQILGVILGFFGVVAVVFSHPNASISDGGVGDLMIVSAVISFAVGGAIVQYLARDFSALFISWFIYLFGAVFLLFHDLIESSGSSVYAWFPGWWPWMLILFSGIVSTAVTSLVWNRAISVVGVSRTAVFFYWVPVFGVFFSIVLLGESLSGWHIFGFFAVMLGTLLGTRR